MDDLAQRLDNLDKVCTAQKQSGNWDYSAYMLGLANGLILAQAIMHDQEPTYLDAPEKFLTKISADSENMELRRALRLLFEECVLSGNAYAKYHGWPKAIAAARSALAPKTTP